MAARSYTVWGSPEAHRRRWRRPALTGAGYVSVDQCTITENVASNAGGGLWNSSTGVMEVTATTGGRNQAPVGPNLYSDGGLLTVNGNPVTAL